MGERVDVVEDGNALTIESAGRITKLEQLLAAAAVDLDTWEVERWVTNKWEVGAKDPAGRIVVEPLWQVKAWLARREPIPCFPVIRPVQVKATWRRPGRNRRRRGIERALIFADPHFGFSRDVPSAELVPFHDRRALDLVVQIAEDAQPDRVDVLGDWFDFVMWTDKFLRSPKFEYCTQPAICEGHWWLAQLREILPRAKIRQHEGNHDFRMRAQIMTHLRAAYGLKAADEMDLPPAMTPQKLLGLDGLGIEWIGGYPDDEDWLNDALRLSHGEVAKSAPGDTAKVVARESDASEIFGHIHRIELVSRTKFVQGMARPVVAFCPGCVCHIDGRVPGKKTRQNWQQGCALVDYEVDGEMFAITPIPIIEGRAIWQGREFKARARRGDLRRDVPEWRWDGD